MCRRSQFDSKKAWQLLHGMAASCNWMREDTLGTQYVAGANDGSSSGGGGKSRWHVKSCSGEIKQPSLDMDARPKSGKRSNQHRKLPLPTLCAHLKATAICGLCWMGIYSALISSGALVCLLTLREQVDSLLLSAGADLDRRDLEPGLVFFFNGAVVGKDCPEHRGNK